MDKLAVGLLAQLAAFWDHAASAGFALVWSDLGDSADDLLGERLCLIVAAGLVKLIIVIVFLIGLICYISGLFVLFIALLMYLGDQLSIFENIFDV